MRAFYLPSLHPQPTHLPLHRRTPCQWWWFPTSVRCPMPGRPSCGTTCWPTTPRLVPSDSSLHGGPQAPSSSKWANVLFSIERELFHEAPNWNLGSGGRGAKLAVLFHHEARVEHRAIDYAGRETPRSAFYLFALLRSSEKEPGLHLGKFTEQGQKTCTPAGGELGAEEVCLLVIFLMRREADFFYCGSISLTSQCILESGAIGLISLCISSINYRLKIFSRSFVCYLSYKYLCAATKCGPVTPGARSSVCP